MDVFTKEKRSEVMSKIRGSGNRSTERRLAAILRAHAISGWKLHPADVAGKPDFFFPSLQFAIFVDGCFWHACPKCFRMPATNNEFWTDKISRNIKRDRTVARMLRTRGICVWRLWEHDLERKTKRVRDLVARLKRG